VYWYINCNISEKLPASTLGTSVFLDYPEDRGSKFLPNGDLREGSIFNNTAARNSNVTLKFIPANRNRMIRG
jgi:hypothetical protein